MEQLIDILNDLCGGVDVSSETQMMTGGLLHSLDVVALVTAIDEAFGVRIPAEEIRPENFDSAAALWALIRRLDEA